MHEAWTPATWAKLAGRPSAAQNGRVAGPDDHRVAGSGLDTLGFGRIGQLPSVHRLPGPDEIGAPVTGNVVEHAAGHGPLPLEVDGAAVLDGKSAGQGLVVPAMTLGGRHVAKGVEMGLGESVDEHADVIQHPSRGGHGHEMMGRIGVGRTGLGVDRTGHGDDSTLLDQSGRRLADLRRDQVQRPELVVGPPTSPVAEAGAVGRVIRFRRWRSIRQTHVPLSPPERGAWSVQREPAFRLGRQEGLASAPGSCFDQGGQCG